MKRILRAAVRVARWLGRNLLSIIGFSVIAASIIRVEPGLPELAQMVRREQIRQDKAVGR